MKEANMFRKTLWTLLLIPSLTGCGLLFVDGPPVGWENVEDPSELEAVALMTPCTSGKTLIYMDAALAAIHALYFLEADWDDDFKDQGLLFTGVFAGTFGLSAVTGNRRVNECAAFNAHVYQQLRNSAEGNDNR
jgi:hypothetical protein